MMDYEEAATALEAIVEAVRTVAAEQPNYVYAKPLGSGGCASYAPDERNPCGCLVGAAMRSIDYTEMDANRYEHEAAISMLRSVLRHPQIVMNEDLASPIESVSRCAKALKFMDWAQFENDSGRPWIECVNRADAEVEEAVLEAEG